MMDSILVVEDEEWLRLTLCEYLESEGYLIDCAENGKVALNLLQKKHSLIVLDLAMPEVDGWMFLKCKAKQEAQQKVHTPVIVFTGVSNPGLEEYDVAAVIEKPAGLDTIRREIERLLGRR